MAYLTEISGQDAEKAAPRASCEVSHEINGLARIVEMKTLLPYNNLIGFYYCIIDKNAQAF
jgi:hypothetical protein